jgi:5-methylcytosine-specific restriction endonuclease McrA
MGNVATNGSKWIQPKKRLAIYERDDFTCLYCGLELTGCFEKFRTLDHLLSQELGGGNGAKNLVTCCFACNSQKGKKSVRKFLKHLRSKNINTDIIKARIRKHLSRKLKGVVCRVKGNESKGGASA